MILKRFLVVICVFSFVFNTTRQSMYITEAFSILPKSTFDGFQTTILHQTSFFTENKGQWDPEILFIGDTSFGKVAFSKRAIYYQLIQKNAIDQRIIKASSFDQCRNESMKQTISIKSHIIKISFIQPLFPKIQGKEMLNHYNNYLIGNSSKKWVTNCRNFDRVTYENIWEGIDLTYFFTNQGLKYEFYVSPDANINDLLLKVEGANISCHGTLMQLATPIGNIQDLNLFVFDQITHKSIHSFFSVKGNLISFQGISKKRENTIIIDPLLYSTYLGGSSGDLVYAIAVDAEGNTFFTGSSLSTDFPTTPGVVQTTTMGAGDVFVSKLNSTGTSLLYSTYLGGAGVEIGEGIAVDAEGNAFIAGSSSSTDFPTTPGTYQTSSKGAGDAFVAKLNPSGTTLLYCTFLGGALNDLGFRIDLDSGGNAYVAGRTYSADFPTTLGVYQSIYKGGDADAFVAKLNPSGTTLLYSTYLGGSSYDSIMGISIDEWGNAFIAGYTRSTDFPTTLNAYQSSNKGFWDAFVSKLNPNGTSLLYSTYVGGADYDYIEWGIAVDKEGNAFIAGYSSSTDFPTTPGSYQASSKGAGDAFVAKLNPSGTSLLYSTYLGGTGADFIQGGIAVDKEGNAFIAGYSSSTDFPTTPDSYQASSKGAGDAFVAKLNPSGTSLLYSTYLGGTEEDIAQGISLDSEGYVYVAGYTLSTDFPTTPDAYQVTNRGGSNIKEGGDVFIVKLSLNLSVIVSNIYLSPSLVSLTVGETQQFAVLVFDQNNQKVQNLLINWFVQGDIGIISSSGFFTAQKKGSGQILVSCEGKESAAYVTVIDKIEKSSIIITLKIGMLLAIVNNSGQSKVVTMDIAPFTKNGRTMVPIRFISESFGAKIDWIPEPINEIIIIYREYTIHLWIDKTIARIIHRIEPATMKEVILEVAPYTVKDRTVVPLRFIVEAFGAAVNWDSISQTIIITLYS
jgi:hypothetical protein